MIHAHEAAVAKARQAWRLEFWQRVVLSRMERVRRLGDVCERTIDDAKGHSSDWNEAMTMHSWRHWDSLQEAERQAATWQDLKALAELLEWTLWIMLYPREEHAVWLGHLDWLKAQTALLFTPQKAATP